MSLKAVGTLLNDMGYVVTMRLFTLYFAIGMFMLAATGNASTGDFERAFGKLKTTEDKFAFCLGYFDDVGQDARLYFFMSPDEKQQEEFYLHTTYVTTLALVTLRDGIIDFGVAEDGLAQISKLGWELTTEKKDKERQVIGALCDAEFAIFSKKHDRGRKLDVTLKKLIQEIKSKEPEAKRSCPQNKAKNSDDLKAKNSDDLIALLAEQFVEQSLCRQQIFGPIEQKVLDGALYGNG